MWFLSTAFAGPLVGPFVGVHSPSAQHELYVQSEAAHEPLGTAGLFGLRVGWEAGPVFAELEGAVGPFLTRTGTLAAVRVHGGVAADLGGVRPMLLAGGGVLMSTALGTDVDRSFYAGPALGFRLSPAVELRLDGRWLLGSRQGDGLTHHGELLLGVNWRPSKRLIDRDGDGVADSVDQCPDNAELQNGYDDEDGCPDELGQITVKVLDAEQRLLRNVEVTRDGVPIGTTNRDGRVLLKDVMPKAQIRLSANMPGLSPVKDAAFEVVPGNSTAEIVLGWAPGTLVVTARNLGGTPLAADVWAQHENAQERWTLDPEGRAEKVLPVGRWRVMIAKDGYDAIIKIVDLPDAVGIRGRVEAVLKPQRIQLRSDQIMTLDPVLFRKGSHELEDETLGLVEAIAAVLVSHPELLQVEVAGHASAEGNTEANQQLSQRRVEEVKRLLVERGVDANRLSAIGYGETKPRTENDTEEGRARNRRVDFLILKVAPK